MSRPIIFLGESQQIGEIKETCDLLNMPVEGVIDDDYFGNTESIDGIPVIGSELTMDLKTLARDHDFFITVNALPSVPRNVQKRKKFVDLVNALDLPCANIVDPQARVSPRAVLGKGIFIGFTVQISMGCYIGDHCQIHTFCGMAHDTRLGTNVILQRACMITSSVDIKDHVYLAPGCKILQPKSTIGSNSFIHSGMLVFRDVAPDEIVRITGRKIYSTLAEIPEKHGV